MTAKAKLQKLSRARAAILGVVIAVLILALGLIWQSSIAGETELTGPKLEIVAANVEYAESLHLYYGVDAILPDGVEKTDVKIIVFTEKPDENAYTIAAATAMAELGKAYVRGYHGIEDITVGSTTYEDCVVFNTEGISAKNIVDDIYIVAYVEYDGVAYYSEPLKYSVLQYVYDRRNDLKNDSSAEAKAKLNLYSRTLEYGAAAQNVLGYKKDRLATASFKSIKIDGGVLADGFTKGLFAPGDIITVTPDYEESTTIYAPNNTAVGDGLTMTVTDSTASGTYTVAASSTVVNFEGMTINGLTSGQSVTPGEKLTLVANAAPENGYLRFHWDLEGKIDVPTAKPAAENTYTCTYTVPFSKNGEPVTLKAVYADNEEQIPVATFDGVTVVKDGKLDNGNRFTTSVGATAKFEVVEIPDINQNKNNVAIHMIDDSNESYATLNVYANGNGVGKKTVFQYDMLIAGSSSGLTSEIDIGTSYRMELYGSEQVLYIQDRNNTANGDGLRNDLGAELYYGSWNKIRIEYYYVGENSMYSVLYINDEAISISSSQYQGVEKAPSHIRLYGMKGETLDCYYDNIKCYRTDCNDELTSEDLSALLNKGVPQFSIPTAETNWNNRYNMLKRLFKSDKFAGTYNGEEDYKAYAALWRVTYPDMDEDDIKARYASEIGNLVADSLEYWSNELFDTAVYEWLAGLYDPKTGGFYYSESARDTYGYLPDIESSGQSSGIMAFFGGSLSSVLTDEQKAKLGAWAQFSQSNEDGYFYHPQWGTDIGASRRSRDLGNYMGKIKDYSGDDYLFTHALKRLNSSYDATKASAAVYDYYVAPAPKKSMTARLDTSVAVMVSKITLAADTSSMPQHLTSLDKLDEYLKTLWGGKDATAKAIGHSYGFGNTITSQNSQFKAAGQEYKDKVIEFLNDKQAEAQQLIFDGAMELEKLVYGENARSDVDIQALLASEAGYTVPGLATSIKYNGLWESGGVYFEAPEVKEGEAGYEAYRLYKRAAAHKEKLAVTITGADGKEYKGYQIPAYNYNFVSGLLKISGIYNSLGYEMPYSAEALQAAIAMMTDSADHYKALGESVVSVYNPPNAINNILKNLNTYGNLDVRNAARAQIQANALEIVETTMAKIAIYKCNDGGFSYGINNSAQSSQGEPAAYGNRKEGDVNGTALALGARKAMLSALGLSDIQILPSHEGSTTYDYGKGEVETTHLEIFKYLLSNNAVAGKNDQDLSGAYDYENLDNIPSNSADEEKNAHTVTIENVTGPNGTSTNALYMKDNEKGTGLTVYFDSLSVESENTYYELSADMKYTTTGDLQIYLNKLKLQIYSEGGYMEFQGRTSDDKVKESAKTFGKAIKATEWFNMCVRVYPGGTEFDGKTVYAVLTVTQGDTTVSEGYALFGADGWEAAQLDSVRFYTTQGSEAGIYIDNVICRQYGKISDGGYNFDQSNVIKEPGAAGITGGEIVKDETTKVVGALGNEMDNHYLKIESENTASLVTGIVGGAFNFNELQFSLLLKDAVDGDNGTVTLYDDNDLGIASIGYTVSDVKEENGIKTATVTITSENVEGGKLIVMEKVELGTAIDVRVELHYAKARLDVVTRYRTAEAVTEGEETNIKYGYDAKAAVINNYKTIATEAKCDKFDYVTISATKGTVYVDDVFARNVLKEYAK